MKTPTFLALLLLAVPAFAQSGAGASPGGADTLTVKPPGAEQPAAPDKTTHTSDSGGTPREGQSVQTPDDFERMDTDRDGKVSPKEYAASDVAAVDMVAAGKRSGTEAPRGGFDLRSNEGRPERSTFFRRLDTDRDGFISRAEFEAAKTPVSSDAKR